MKHTRDNKLASLVGSRICHDLISPVGAINNGLELLTLTDAPQGEELALVTASAMHAEARTRFMRIAYGNVSDHDLPASEVRSILDGVAASMPRFDLHWTIEGPTPRWAVRLAFLALQCVESAMPLGGAISVARDNETWVVTGIASRTEIDPDLWNRLIAECADTDVAAAHVEFVLLPIAARDYDRTLNTTLDAGKATIRF